MLLVKKIVINDIAVTQVQGFNYLGYDISYSYENDLEQMLSRFQTVPRVLKKKAIKYTQIKFYKVIAVPVAVYGSEDQTLNRSERRKIETAEMSFLRHISGYTLTDHVCRATICNTLQICFRKKIPRLQK